MSVAPGRLGARAGAPGECGPPTIRAVFALRRHLRRGSWLALLAVLTFALAPTVSHALAHARGSTAWVEVCTPQGMQMVAVDSQSAPAETPALGGHLEHCPWCGLGGSHLGLPPAELALRQASAPRDAVPALFLQAHRPRFAWAAAQPRGPPASA